MVQSSFYSDEPNYATDFPTQNDGNTNPVDGNPTAPSSFYPEGGVYAALANSDTVIAEMQALEASAAAHDASSATHETNAANSAASAANSAANAAAAVQAAAGTATPLMDGVAAVGTGTKWAHEDHRHPTDTSRADAAATTAALATKADAAATTAALALKADKTYVDSQDATKADDAATTAALALKAPLASPALTGTPTAPTPSVGDNSTKIATTAFVLANSSSGSTVYVSDTEPVGAADNALWWESDSGALYVRYNDGTSTQWVPAVAVPDVSGFVLTSAIREKLTANRTYYVRTDGSDSNNGLTNTSGGAFLTLQKAMDVIAGLDCSIYDLTVNVGGGTYSSALVLKSYLGSGQVSFIGDTTTPSNVVISAAGAAVSTTAVGGRFTVSGFRLQSSAAQDVAVGSATSVTLSNIEYNGSSANYRIYANSAGKLTCSGANHKVLTGGLGLFLVEQHAFLLINSATFTFGASVTYSSATVTSRHIGYMEASGATFTLGAFTVTGTRYTVIYNGGVAGTGAGASFFPGTVAGSATVGGYYV